MNRLEKEISKLEAKKDQLHLQFTDTTNLTPDRIKELSQELELIKEKIEDKELRWMELAEMA
ncbi:MAG: ABC transporter C-terminal domain-containing protein [Bacteroidota bacterium]